MPARYFVLALIVAFYCAGFFATFFLTTDWTARQTIAIALTGLIVIWYTWETMLLRQTAVVQRELQTRPFVIFLGDVGNFRVENLGASPALGVIIQAVKYTEDGIDLLIEFPTTVPILHGGETLPIETKVTINGRKIDAAFAAHIDPKYAEIEVAIAISFRSIEGKAYKLAQVTAPRSMTIRGFRESA